MSPIDQKTRPLKENHLIQRVLHRPVELAGILRKLDFRGRARFREARLLGTWRVMGRKQRRQFGEGSST